MRRSLVGGTVLIGDRLVPDTTVAMDGERICAVGQTVGSAATIDARGLLVLPGLVDLHADAVERALEPRSGVRLPVAIALAEHESWLLANGITTCFVSLTDGFEPGLRSRDVVREVIAAAHDLGSNLAVRTPIHLRREVCAPGEADEVVAWLAAGRIGLLSINDHLPPGESDGQHARFIASLRRRLDRQAPDLERLIADARARRERGLADCDRLSATARAHAVPLAAHDDATPDAAEASAARGIAISEFPADLATARRARQLGAQVLMGAVNAVRGSSHVGMMSATEAIAAGVCDALCSDYHPPSLFHAPFVLSSHGHMEFAAAWNLASRGPAQAALLTDRGRLATGCRADLVLVETGPRPRVRAVWIGGREVARFG